MSMSSESILSYEEPCEFDRWLNENSAVIEEAFEEAVSAIATGTGNRLDPSLYARAASEFAEWVYFNFFGGD